jgi:hypothetical protein
VTVGGLSQSLELGLAVDLELALENMARGRAAQGLVHLAHRGRQLEAARNASISTKLNFSAPSTPIIHLQLARSDSFKLILRWNRVKPVIRD